MGSRRHIERNKIEQEKSVNPNGGIAFIIIVILIMVIIALWGMLKSNNEKEAKEKAVNECWLQVVEKYPTSDSAERKEYEKCLDERGYVILN